MYSLCLSRVKLVSHQKMRSKPDPSGLYFARPLFTGEGSVRWCSLFSRSFAATSTELWKLSGSCCFCRQHLDLNPCHSPNSPQLGIYKTSSCQFQLFSTPSSLSRRSATSLVLDVFLVVVLIWWSGVATKYFIYVTFWCWFVPVHLVQTQQGNKCFCCWCVVVLEGRKEVWQRAMDFVF